jgi:hypothetical protein
MKSKIPGVLVLSILSVAVALAQTSTNTTSTAPTNGNSTPEPEPQTMVPARDNQSLVRRLVKVSGVLTDFAGKPLSGEVQVKFTLYKEETDEEPLWTETQKLGIDTRGRYTALLGATQTGGVPVELFGSDDARWLGVEVEGQPPRPRTLLLSVPYALKAVEAEKLAGKSVSDFVLSENLGEQVRQVIQSQGQVAAQSTLIGTPQQKQASTVSTASPQVSSPGPKFPPSTFSGITSNQIVLVQQNGSGQGLVAQTASSTGGSGVVGIATSNSTSNFQNGVYGQNAGAGAGVAGIATNPSSGVGVYGQGANFAGVFGNSPKTSGFAAGVFGQTASSDGAGVHGNNTAATGFATGVTGFSASTNGNGVFGNASATSGFANGVFGQTASPGGSGVLGIENSPSGFNSGVSGSSASANGTGVFGSSVQWVGVGGQATATSGSPAYGVWGDSASTDGVGVAGYADATSGNANGVLGVSVSPNGNGLIGVNNASTGPCNQNYCDGGFGVRGIANGTNGNAYGVLGSTATIGFGAGVLGSADATTGQAFGVFGQTNSPNGPAIFGHAASPSGYPTAVVGFLDSNDGGVAGQFVAHGGSGLILQGLSGSNFNQVFSLDANGNLNITGNLTVSGTKSSTAKLQSGREVALYAVESPENWFEDFGSAELKGGVGWVPLDSSFAEATNAAITYHVFLTANGDSNGLYVARKTPTGFEVREHGSRDSNVAFDYRIVVRRRGYETIRMAEVPGDARTVESSRRHLAQLVNSGNLKKAGVVAAPQTGSRPTIRPVPPRPRVPQLPTPSVPQPSRPR